MSANSFLLWFGMNFPERLASLRKACGLTQQALADNIGVTVLQVHRYEAGTSQPTLDVIRRLSIALSVSADMLIFDEQERQPIERMRYQFEAISRMPEHEQNVILELLDAMIVKNQIANTMARITPQTERNSG